MRASLKDRLLSFPFYFLPHHHISWLMLKLSRIQNKIAKNFIIRSYTNLIPVNMSEAVEEDKYAYASLNAFFTRELKSECRPFDEDPNSWLCPVDGAISQAMPIQNGRIFQAKGLDYSLLELVGGDEDIAQQFTHGHFSTIYLSPSDYHRIHMPTAGSLKKMLYIPGRLFSVADHTVNAIPRLFTRNERCACYFETESGPMALILVGAINVSAIETVWHGIVTSDGEKITPFDYEENAIELKRGEEMGRFNLGSTVIVLTTDKFNFDMAITAKATVKLGQRLGGF